MTRQASGVRMHEGPPPKDAQALPARRHLALYFPFLASDRLVRTPTFAAATAVDAPFALVEERRGAMRIAAVDARAAARGLAPGMALADARAILPDLAACDADPAADQDWIERIADLCERYTPMVALDGADGVTLDITGRAHPFGGEEGLLADLERRCEAWSDHFRLALAESPEGAQALARFQAMPGPSEAAALRRLDVAALRLSGETVTALRRAGLRTIGDLAARPSAPLAARFGAQTIAVLGRMLGDADSHIQPRRGLPALFFERRFAEPIARTGDVLGVIEELANEAAATLAERNKGGRRFAMRLFRGDGQVRDLAIEVGLPARDSPTLTRLFRERIDALADPLDSGSGFDMVRFAVPKIEPLAPTQLQLEGGMVGAALADRLRKRPGRASARRVVPRNGHVPEQGVLSIPALDTRRDRPGR